MRALKALTVLGLSLVNWISYLLLEYMTPKPEFKVLFVLVGTTISFMLIRKAARIAFTSTETGLEEKPVTEGKYAFNILADPAVPKGTVRLVNSETGQILGTITNIRLEDK